VAQSMATVDAAARRAALSRSAMFKVLEPAEIDAVLAQAAVRRIARNEVILRRGDPSSGANIVVSGRVRIGTISEDGREVTLGVLGAGDVIGEMSVLDGEDASADVTALEDCVLLFIERARFLRLLHGNSDLCLRLMAVLCRRIRRANATVEDMALLDLDARLARLLLRLAQDYGAPAQRGTRIEVKLSQKDLGTLVGSSREKVNKQLREWEAEGVLGKEQGHMVILRAEALTGVAHPA
jgi:CRP/FNR family transcriptional regulator, cyclic AMP receptor protein